MSDKPLNLGQRISILGCSGSGKSTLARKLSEKLQLPVYHLDTYYWQPAWVATDPGEFIRQNDEIIAQDRWIIEGNYSITRARRLARSDTILYIDESPWRCAARFVRRAWFERERTDLPEGCCEPVLNAELLSHLHDIFCYRQKSLPRHKIELEMHKQTCHVVWLRSPNDVAFFLASINSRALARQVLKD
ncbi:MAG: hypothetical protein AAF512_07835 [Pseudomonadota bacterium]